MSDKAKVKEICGNCLLYNCKKSICKVAIFEKGREIHIPVDPEDLCFFDNKFVASPSLFNPETFQVEVKQIRFFEDDGKVKIEYPEDLLPGDISMN